MIANAALKTVHIVINFGQEMFIPNHGICMVYGLDISHVHKNGKPVYAGNTLVYFHTDHDVFDVILTKSDVENVVKKLLFPV